MTTQTGDKKKRAKDMYLYAVYAVYKAVLAVA